MITPKFMKLSSWQKNGGEILQWSFIMDQMVHVHDLYLYRPEGTQSYIVPRNILKKTVDLSRIQEPILID